MSKKQKTTQPSEVKLIEVVSFRVFFHECVRKNLLQPWQEREIHVFFKDLGLTDKEPTDTYKIALAKF